ncbi:unnamed protein product [Prorocentrum cordatum]|uniref:Uncharacterized protein n=1 Tax=Prorocentrum cordatum TaxID=2364126 RepID=A0ABN9QCJ6_9DINO|nr:unnamed protein product [Polarella glacialis]
MEALRGTRQEGALPWSHGLLLATPPHSPRRLSSHSQAPPGAAVAAKSLPGLLLQDSDGQAHAAQDVDLLAASEPFLDHAKIAAMQRHLSAASAHIEKLLVARGADASAEGPPACASAAPLSGAIQPQSSDRAGVAGKSDFLFLFLYCSLSLSLPLLVRICR